jgi:hypothetical protein
MFIYLTTNKINNKKYIGLCTRDDDLYLGSGKLIKAAIAKYGKDNFERIIIEECNSINELSKAERKWIEHYDAVNSDEFYNLSEGGNGGNSVTVKRYWDSMTTEERKERNKYMKERDRSADKPSANRSEISSKSMKSHWGTLTEEQRKERLSKWTYDHSGKNNPMFGRSAVKERNLKWYNNGEQSIYVTEGTQPSGYIPGRGKIKWQL